MKDNKIILAEDLREDGYKGNYYVRSRERGIYEVLGLQPDVYGGIIAHIQVYGMDGSKRASCVDNLEILIWNH